jgi:hypothetical protein
VFSPADRAGAWPGAPAGVVAVVLGGLAAAALAWSRARARARDDHPPA